MPRPAQARAYAARAHTPDPAPPPPPDDGDQCPGACNARYRAAERHRAETGTDHPLTARTGRPVWCPPCVTAIRGALTDLPALAAALHQQVHSGLTAVTLEPSRSPGGEPRIHQHQTASLLLDEIAEYLAEWAASLAAHRRLPDPTRVRAHTDPVTATADACAFLDAHLSWHLNGRPADEHEVAAEFGTQTLGYHRRAQLITSTTPGEPRRCGNVPCPECGYNTLEYEVAEGTATVRTSVFDYDQGGQVRRGPTRATLSELDGAALLAQVIARADAAGMHRPYLDETAFHAHLADIDAQDAADAADHYRRAGEVVLTPRLIGERARALAAARPARRHVTVLAAGAVTGYVRCRRCRPTFRMPLDEYHAYLAEITRGRKRPTPTPPPPDEPDRDGDAPDDLAGVECRSGRTTNAPAGAGRPDDECGSGRIPNGASA